MLEGKERRYMHRFLSGLEKAKLQHKFVRFGTLTSSDNATDKDISRDFDVLVKRIRRKSSSFDYAKVIVKKNGRNHIHFIFTGAFIAQKWLSSAWGDLHNSSIVDIRQCRNINGLARYMVTQYMSVQDCDYTRMSYSENWIFAGAIKVWKNLVDSVKNGYYYNPVSMKYFKNRIEVPFSIIMKRILDLWYIILRRSIESPHSCFVQLFIDDYG